MRRASLPVAAALLVSLAAGGCGTGTPGSTLPPLQPQTFGPSRGTTAAVAQTRALIAAALGERSLQLADPQVPFRPPESGRVAAAPRAVYQAVLPNDRNHGFISVYEFADPPAAGVAGRELADFLGSGPGRVQFPLDTRFVVRQLGTTIVYFTWSPASSLDPRTADIQPALETLGTPIPVPR